MKNNIGYTQQIGYRKLDFLALKIVGLDCERICSQVQELVNEYTNSGKVMDDSFLVIRICNPSCTIDPELPKLENIKIPES